MNDTRPRWPSWVIALIGAVLGTIGGTIAGGFTGAFLGENVFHTEGLEALGPVLLGMAGGALIGSTAAAFGALAVAGRREPVVAFGVGGTCPVAAFFIVVWWPVSAVGIAAVLVFAITSVWRRDEDRSVHPHA